MVSGRASPVVQANCGERPVQSIAQPDEATPEHVGAALDPDGSGAENVERDNRAAEHAAELLSDQLEMPVGMMRGVSGELELVPARTR
jgi:hypothetical protein